MMSDGATVVMDAETQEAEPYAKLDRVIGMAVRYADELGFHFCSTCITKKTGTDEPMLRIGVGMFTANRTTVRASGSVVLGVGTMQQLRRHLRQALVDIGDLVEKDGLDVGHHPYAHLRQPWSESLKFGPEFLVEDEEGVLTEYLP